MKEYIQEIGCVGCDGLPAEAELFREAGKLNSIKTQVNIRKVMLHVTSQLYGI